MQDRSTASLNAIVKRGLATNAKGGAAQAWVFLTASGISPVDTANILALACRTPASEQETIGFPLQGN